VPPPLSIPNPPPLPLPPHPLLSQPPLLLNLRYKINLPVNA